LGKLVALLLRVGSGKLRLGLEGTTPMLSGSGGNWEIRHTTHSAVERIVTRLPRRSII